MKKILVLVEGQTEELFVKDSQVHEFEAYLFSFSEGFNKVFFDRNKDLERINNIINFIIQKQLMKERKLLLRRE